MGRLEVNLNEIQNILFHLNQLVIFCNLEMQGFLNAEF